MPTFECKQCGQCCGPIPFTIRHFDRFKSKAVRIYKLEYFAPGFVVANTEDGKCPFLDYDNLCLIYKDRPVVCRIYAINKKLPCWYQDPIRANEEFGNIVGRIKSKMESD